MNTNNTINEITEPRAEPIMPPPAPLMPPMPPPAPLSPPPPPRNAPEIPAAFWKLNREPILITGLHGIQSGTSARAKWVLLNQEISQPIIMATSKSILLEIIVDVERLIAPLKNENFYQPMQECIKAMRDTLKDLQDTQNPNEDQASVITVNLIILANDILGKTILTNNLTPTIQEQINDGVQRQIEIQRERMIRQIQANQRMLIMLYVLNQESPETT